MHILLPLWHCAGTVCSLRFVKVFGKKSREWISRQNNATSAATTTTTKGGSVDGQTASIITALHAVTAKNTLRMYVWMYICMYNCTFGKRVHSHEQPLTHTLSRTMHALALSQLTPSRSRAVPSALFILFLLSVHWPSARVVENHCTASCICPRVVRSQCRKCGTSSWHTRCILSHAHVTSHLFLALWQLQLHAQQAYIHTCACTCMCECVYVWVWASFYSPRCCCCWCRLNFVVCFAVARGLH